MTHQERDALDQEFTARAAKARADGNTLVAWAWEDASRLFLAAAHESAMTAMQARHDAKIRRIQRSYQGAKR